MRPFIKKQKTMNEGTINRCVIVVAVVGKTALVGLTVQELNKLGTNTNTSVVHANMLYRWGSYM